MQLWNPCEHWPAPVIHFPPLFHSLTSPGEQRHYGELDDVKLLMLWLYDRRWPRRRGSGGRESVGGTRKQRNVARLQAWKVTRTGLAQSQTENALGAGALTSGPISWTNDCPSEGEREREESPSAKIGQRLLPRTTETFTLACGVTFRDFRLSITRVTFQCVQPRTKKK